MSGDAPNSSLRYDNASAFSFDYNQTGLSVAAARFAFISDSVMLGCSRFRLITLTTHTKSVSLAPDLPDISAQRSETFVSAIVMQQHL
jgi:hypothetical protein